MDTEMWALVIGWVALAIALLCAFGTLYALARPPRDTDVEELADEVGRLARRSRADTMRRVRAEARVAPADVQGDAEPPPELRQAQPVSQDPRALKQAMRQRMLTH